MQPHATVCKVTLPKDIFVSDEGKYVNDVVAAFEQIDFRLLSRWNSVPPFPSNVRNSPGKHRAQIRRLIDVGNICDFQRAVFWKFRSAKVCFHIHSGRFTNIYNEELSRKRFGSFSGDNWASHGDPRSLIEIGVINRRIQGFLGGTLPRNAIGFRNALLNQIAALHLADGTNCGTGSGFSSISCGDSCASLLTSVIGISPGDEDEQNGAGSFNVDRWVRWFICGLCYLLAIGLAIAAFAIFVSFDRWRQGWWWGIMRCVGIAASLYGAIWIIGQGLILVGA